MIIGIVIIIFGVLLLLQNLGFITYNIWGLFWPLVLIVIGLKIATKKGGRHNWCYFCKQEEKKEEKPQQ
jgi:predicted membrane protein